MSPCGREAGLPFEALSAQDLAMTSSANTATAGYEAEPWSMAEALRSSMDDAGRKAELGLRR